MLATCRTHHPWAQTILPMIANRRPVIWRWSQLYHIWMQTNRSYEREHFELDLLSMKLSPYVRIRKMMGLCNWRTINKRWKWAKATVSKVHVHISCRAAMNVQMSGAEECLAQYVSGQCWPQMQKSLFTKWIRSIVCVPLEFPILNVME